MAAETDPRVDTYIAGVAPFAQPLLTYLRDCVHAGCPDVRETLKWSRPFFMHGDTVLAYMSAFKAHCGFGFWGGNEVAERGKSDEAMGQFGRITTRADLPGPREMKALVKAAVAKIDAGATKRVKKNGQPERTPRPALEMPPDFAGALQASAAARQGYDGLSPSQRRDYVEWVLEAKREATRASRIQTSLEWLAEGKARHWKYENC